MADLPLELNWLNMRQPSTLTLKNQYWVTKIADKGLTDDERRAIIQELVKSVNQQAGIREQAEVLVFCGYWGSQGLDCETARTWLNQAAIFYEKLNEPHRQAVALWLLSRCERSLGKYSLGFRNAKRARKIFIECGRERVRLNDVGGKNWYDDRVIGMTFDLISIPEMMYEWLFEFKGTRLSEATSQIKALLQSQIENKNFQEAYPTIRMLHGMTLRSVDCEETAEALAYCGLATWVLENRQLAVKYLTLAMAQYIPRSHEYAVVRWMLALIQYTIPDWRAKAVTNLETAITDFDCLREKSIKMNQTEKREWYEFHLKAMRKLLVSKINDRALLT